MVSDNDNEDDDDDEDDNDIDFGNFSTCSPRFSRLISTVEPPNTTHLKQLKEQASKEVSSADDEDRSDGASGDKDETRNRNKNKKNSKHVECETDDASYKESENTDNDSVDLNENADDSSTQSSAPSSPLALNTTTCDTVRKKLDSVLLLNSSDNTATDSGNDSGTPSSGQSSLNASLNSGLSVNTSSAGLRPSLLKQIHVDVRRQHHHGDDSDRDTE